MTKDDGHSNRLAKEIAAIESQADRILDEIGLRFEGDQETIEVWHNYGARIDGDKVYLDGSGLRELIRERAPKTITMLAMVPSKDKKIGPGHPPVLAPVYGPPDVLLRDGTRTGGSQSLYRELVSIADTHDGIGNTGHMLCVMHDVAEAERSIQMANAHLECSEKPFMGSVSSPHDALAVIEVTKATIRRECDDIGSCHFPYYLSLRRSA